MGSELVDIHCLDFPIKGHVINLGKNLSWRGKYQFIGRADP